MALSFTPLFHVEAESGVWHQPLNTLAPFGRYPSMHELRRISDEAATIESQGEKVITMVFGPKDDSSRNQLMNSHSPPVDGLLRTINAGVLAGAAIGGFIDYLLFRFFGFNYHSSLEIAMFVGMIVGAFATIKYIYSKGGDRIQCVHDDRGQRKTTGS